MNFAIPYDPHMTMVVIFSASMQELERVEGLIRGEAEEEEEEEQEEEEGGDMDEGLLGEWTLFDVVSKVWCVSRLRCSA